MKRIITLTLALCLTLAATASWAGETSISIGIQDEYGNGFQIQASDSDYDTSSTLNQVVVVNPDRRPEIAPCAPDQRFRNPGHMRKAERLAHQHRYAPRPMKMAMERHHYR